MVSTVTQAAIDTLQIVELSRYSFCAAITFYLLHFLSTIFSEVEVIWKLPWSPMKILYFINRYYGLVSVVTIVTFQFLQTSNIMCDAFTLFTGCALWLSILIVQIILAVRMYVILGSKRWHIIAITVLFIAESGSTIAVTLHYASATSVTFEDVTYCHGEAQWVCPASSSMQSWRL
ncbi:hypothetical protein NEOLEDRAFT_313322 [Neolentinus lepideus HHB14362 ss-1]|uniref:DUF6533 domain-containing protein n=1 Tax=Neolentinus lepideus HHB14362 ss-1 TaxID=1314782 RepID=A0A165VT92_9AGAM|nr:hypothetical protein NEOLEDRAFT_313322 [Neolentinus lepideus HHB14362 ss-1]